MSRDAGQWGVGSDLVVLLHGLGGSTDGFGPLVHALSGLPVLVVAPDLPGHGLASPVGNEYLTVEGMARYVSRIIADHQDLFRVHVVGHSLGGAVALDVVSMSPIPVVSLVNVEGNLVSSDCGVSRAIAVAEPGEAVSVAMSAIDSLYRANGRQSFEAWTRRFSHMSSEQLHRTAASLVAESDNGQLLETFLDLAIPKVYICGQDSANEDVLAQLGDTPTLRIADADHFVMDDQPDAFAEAVSRWLGEQIANPPRT